MKMDKIKKVKCLNQLFKKLNLEKEVIKFLYINSNHY